MIPIDRGRLYGGHSILPLGTWMQRAAGKTADAISDGPGHVVTDLYRDPQVKAALEKIFHSKCAYCESPGFAGFSWDVEHFRPKGSVAEAAARAGVSASALKLRAHRGSRALREALRAEERRGHGR